MYPTLAQIVPDSDTIVPDSYPVHEIAGSACSEPYESEVHFMTDQGAALVTLGSRVGASASSRSRFDLGV